MFCRSLYTAAKIPPSLHFLEYKKYAAQVYTLHIVSKIPNFPHDHSSPLTMQHNKMQHIPF
jgi:hypothetical protein